MANIAEEINKNSTVNTINKMYEDKNKQRRRLGLSQAGHKCKRFLWFKHRGYDEPKIEGRVLRLFELGNIVEDHIANDLREAGFNLHSQQKEVVFTYEDITLKGHIDGIIEGLVEAPKTPHIWECKTANKKKFNDFLAKGYKLFNPVYYWQTQFYMLGLKLKRAAAFVYCKDDSRLAMERIRLNKDATVDRLEDVFQVISQDDPPERACPRIDWFEAKWCPFYNECWGVK